MYNFFYTSGDRCMEQVAEVLVESGPIAMFKQHLDRHMDRVGLEAHGPHVGRWD